MFPATSSSVNPMARFRLTLRRALPALHAALLPPRCLLCGGAGQSRLPTLAWVGPLEICAACQAGLPRSPAWAGPVPSTHAGFDRVCCPWAYGWPVDQLVRALKFNGERSHARLLGTLLVLERHALGPPWPQLLVPVPLHPLRLRERGYNQAAELARHAARAAALPLRAQALERLRSTRPQSGLGAAGRAANVAGAFRATLRTPGIPMAGVHVALVDDVVTTGNTAAAAAQALRAAGAAQVELWAVARAVRRRAQPAAPAASGDAQWPEV
jgi:ComF family protein